MNSKQWKPGTPVIVTHDDSPFLAHKGVVLSVSNTHVFVEIPMYGVRYFSLSVECLREVRDEFLLSNRLA